MIVASSEIAPVMKQAIVAIEDKRFFEHRGVDVRGIVRAVWQDVRNKKVVQGGSTITQQFVKNAYADEQAHDQPQAEGGGARLAARAGVVEGQDPHRLPEHDLLRERRLRDRAGRAGLLRARRVEADARRGGAPRRHPGRPEPLQPGHRTRRRRTRAGARCSRRCSTRRTSPTTSSAWRTGRRCRSPRTSTCPATRGPAQYFVDYVKQQLVDRYGTRQGLRRRAEGQDDDRPRPPGASRARRSRSGCTGRTGRPRRSSRSTRATGACSRWSAATNYRAEPVQPRRAGRAAAGLVVQAVRARGRARAGDLALDDASSRSR